MRGYLLSDISQARASSMIASGSAPRMLKGIVRSACCQHNFVFAKIPSKPYRGIERQAKDGLPCRRQQTSRLKAMASGNGSNSHREAAYLSHSTLHAACLGRGCACAEVPTCCDHADSSDRTESCLVLNKLIVNPESDALLQSLETVPCMKQMLHPCTAAKRATLEDKKALIKKVDAFIFDCDGKLEFQ